MCRVHLLIVGPAYKKCAKEFQALREIQMFEGRGIDARLTEISERGSLIARCLAMLTIVGFVREIFDNDQCPRRLFSSSS